MKKTIQKVRAFALHVDHPFLKVCKFKLPEQLVANTKRRKDVYGLPIAIKFKNDLLVVDNPEHVHAARLAEVNEIDAVIIEGANEAELMAFIGDAISIRRIEKQVERFGIINHLMEYFDTKTSDSVVFYEWLTGGDVYQKIGSLLDLKRIMVYNIYTVGTWDIDYLHAIDNDVPGYSINKGMEAMRVARAHLKEYPVTPDLVRFLELGTQSMIAFLGGKFQSGIKVTEKTANTITLSSSNSPVSMTLQLDWNVGERWGENQWGEKPESSTVEHVEIENELVNA